MQDDLVCCRRPGFLFYFHEIHSQSLVSFVRIKLSHFSSRMSCTHFEKAPNAMRETRPVLNSSELFIGGPLGLLSAFNNISTNSVLPERKAAVKGKQKGVSGFWSSVQLGTDFVSSHKLDSKEESLLLMALWYSRDEQVAQQSRQVLWGSFTAGVKFANADRKYCSCCARSCFKASSMAALFVLLLEAFAGVLSFESLLSSIDRLARFADDGFLEGTTSCSSKLIACCKSNLALVFDARALGEDCMPSGSAAEVCRCKLLWYFHSSSLLPNSFSLIQLLPEVLSPANRTRNSVPS